MSLENLEVYTRKVEALQKYAATVQELAKSQNQNRNMQSRLKKDDEEISKYKHLKMKYAGKVTSLEELNAIILKRTRDTKYEEIERNAQAKFEAEAPIITRKELNRFLTLPSAERPQVLNELLARKVNENVNMILTTEALWPPQFTQQVEIKISTGISAGLNANYYANLNAAIAQAKQDEWPKFLDQYMHKTITPFCKNLIIDQFINACINRPIAKTCYKCGTATCYDLPQDGIPFLFQGDATKGDCSNPRCLDGFFIFRTRHKVQISLADVIAHLAGNPSNPPKPTYVPVYRLD